MQPVDLAPFAQQLEAFPERFRDPAHGHAPDDLRGRFSSRPGGTSDLYGAADLVFVLWIQGRLDERTTRAGREAWVAHLQSFQHAETGWFPPGGLAGHGRPHATAFATAALKLLGAQPRHRFAWAADRFGAQSAVERWLDSLRWSQIWTGSHAAGAAAALLDAPGHAALPAAWRDWLLDALTSRVDAATGLWKRGPLDAIVRAPTTIDLGGAAHFWWLFDRGGRPIPRPARALESILRLQRRSGLWGSRLFGGAYPQGIDFDAIQGMRLAWDALGPGRREALRPRIGAALDRYARAAGRHCNAPEFVARRSRTSHKLVGTLHAIAELALLSEQLDGRVRVRTPRPWRSALTVVAWQ
ncbi:MAG: hypothetical protein QNK03_12360 [Myxococcota bacterium]|nr:hypothetical protein [Myxococcota bacterium]